MTKLWPVGALAAILIVADATVAHAQQPPEPKPFPERHPNPVQAIRMINFAGGFNLPIWMTQRQDRLHARLHLPAHAPDDGFLSISAQKEITSVESLKGRRSRSMP